MSITTRKQIVAIVIAVFAVLPALAQTDGGESWTLRVGEWTYSESMSESVDDFAGEITRRVTCEATAGGDEIIIALSSNSLVYLRPRRDDATFPHGLVRFIWDGGAVESNWFGEGDDWSGRTRELYSNGSIVSKLMRHSHLRLEVAVTRQGQPRTIIDEISLSGSSRAIRQVMSCEPTSRRPIP